MTDETSGPEYLSIKEASAYVGVSPQTLRRWDRSGKLQPVRHRGSGYRYYRRADLEPFRLDYRRAEMSIAAVGELFQTANANIEENKRLREPQRAAHRAAREHFASSRNAAILVLPVGCGKTGVIATLPFGIAEGRVLVITPNTTIRRGVAEALDIANNKCFWTRTQTLTSYTDGPFVAVLDGPDANLHDCVESHFVVTNIQQIVSSADRWLPQFPPDFFDMILVDEGHHSAAPSWIRVLERFPNAKVVCLTATPFRSDERPLSGDVIYRYPFRSAMINGYIKEVHAVNLAPAEIYFTYKDDERRHTLAEVMELREEAWFRKSVALAPECNRHIAEASIQKCNLLRERTGTRHQIIAATCSIDHARQVRAIYEECGIKARELFSEMDRDEQDSVVEDLRSNRIDCIVQVQMLGEGFDHPPLSVAAIFRPFRSLAPYIQFTGRVMRVIHENEKGHADNQAFVVSHIGLNNDAQWNDFRELDGADQQMFHDWLTQVSEGDEIREEGNGRSRRFDQYMEIEGEVLSHFVGESFLDPDDDAVLDEMMETSVAPGLKVGDLIDREALRDRLREKQREFEQKPEAIPVTPQRRRRTTRKRLYERAGAVASRIIQELGLGRAGFDVARSGLVGARGNNTKAITALLNNAINARLGIEPGSRNEPNAEELEEAFAALDELGDGVRDQIKEALE